LRIVRLEEQKEISMWKRIALAAIGIIGLVVMGYLGLILFSLYQERNVLQESKLYYVKAEIGMIEGAVRLFHDANRRYPQNLAELARKPRETANNKPWLIEIPHASPWGSAYQYWVEPGAAGESYKIWTVPDRRTQELLKVTELSNKTDWRTLLR
jgi:hypothetical protein